jgi:predicted nucleotidyltransferase
MPGARTIPKPPAAPIGAIVARFDPRRVILFGSHARGDAGPDSDHDFLVVLDDDAPPEKLRLEAGYEARRGYRRPADVVPCRESTFRRRAQRPGALCHAAATEGVVVYERR